MYLATRGIRFMTGRLCITRAKARALPPWTIDAHWGPLRLDVSFRSAYFAHFLRQAAQLDALDSFPGFRIRS
jgi:hypothetical protein